MKIEYFGHSCFRLTAKNGVRLLTDPYTGVGYELPKGISAEIVTVSHGHFDHNFVQGVTGVEKTVDGVNETSYKGISLVGVESWHDERQGTLRGKNIIFKITIDGVCVCHMGDIGEACSEELLQQIGEVDVLLLPIGGTYTIDALQAKEYVEKIPCKIVIPMHYRPIDGNINVTDEKLFLSLCNNVERVYLTHAFSLGKSDLMGVEKKIVFMEREKNHG